MARNEHGRAGLMAAGWWTSFAAMVLTAVAVFIAPAVEAQASPSTPEPDIMQTGQFVPGLESYDRIVARIMRDHDIPGAAVAVVRYGRLVYARGFGVADRESGTPVQPDSLFRIASLSKPITAVAVLKLVEDGRLELDTRVFRDLLAGIEPHPPADPRMNEITVRDLLRHSGGFDRVRRGDIQWDQKKISRKIRKRPPLDCADVIAYMKRRRLDFSPGERYAYSNFGYCALGRVIEQASGMSYEEYVRQEILIPAGAARMRVADPFPGGRLEDEVKYYDHPGAKRRKSLDGRVRKRVPRPYDGFLSTMDAHGGWAASAVDLLRFVVAVDGRDGDDVLADETVGLMIERSDYGHDDVWYGLGWLVRDIGGGQSNWWCDGSMPGASSLLVRAGNGFSWAVVMNSRPRKWSGFNLAIDMAMWEAFSQVTRWPDHDLFPES